MTKKIGNTVFYLAIMMETLFVLLDKSAYIMQHETWAFRITFLLFCLKIALTKYSYKEWITIVFFVILGILSWHFTDREEIIRMVALVAACKGMDRKQIFRIILYETIGGCLVIILLSLFGIYGTVSVSGEFRGGGIVETRYCFGMGHPNAFHCMMMMIMLLILALYNEKMKWFGYFILCAFNYVIYLFTDSRTSSIISFAMIGLAAVLHYGKTFRAKRILYILGEACLLGCILLSVYISKVGVEKKILWIIDHKLNGRFQWACLKGGIPFWSLFSTASNQEFFDMSYVRLLYWYGIIPTIVILLLLAVVIWKCRELEAYDAFFVLMTFVAYSLIEAHAVSVYIGRNYSLICIGTLLPLILNGNKSTNGKEFSIMDIGKGSIKR